MNRRLTLAETRRLRRTPGATVLLFLTDRCPVGCGHCSVSSRPDSPTITDRGLFAELLAGIAALDDLVAVGLSGGEPFAERAGLRAAVTALRRAGKRTAVYTSGFWASSDRIPEWIAGVLRDIDTVFLSVDGFHAPMVDDRRLVRAGAAAVNAGCHLVLQVLDEPEQRDRLEGLRARLPEDLEVHFITPLRQGRGRDAFQVLPHSPMRAFGACGLTGSPTVRYDGTVLACCGESVIMGAGPAELRRRIRHRDELGPALLSLRSGPTLRVMGAGGPAALAALPAFAGIADQEFGSICNACWAAHDVAGRSPQASRMVTALAAGLQGDRKEGA